MSSVRKIITLVFFCFTAHANEYILMDDQIESFVKEIVYKIKEAIGYKEDINIYVSSNQVLNASAMQSGDIVINAGAILQCSNVDEFIAILAHEIGHISGRHINTYISNQYDFAKAGLVTMLLGAATSILTCNIAPLAAGLFGGQSMSQGMALSKLRQKEHMADSKSIQAIKILKWPVSRGFISIQEKLRYKSVVYDVYLSTHPQSTDRITKFRNFYNEEKDKHFPDENIKLIANWQRKFEAIKLKLKALIFECKTTLELYNFPKNNEEKFAKAIALYRSNRYEKSILELDELINTCDEKTDIAYYAEIKCMCLINIKQCKKAAELAWQILQRDKGTKIHRDLSIIYADAIAEGNLDKKHIEQSIKILKKITILYKNEISAINLLGKLYTMIGKNEHASLCAAEIASLAGDKAKAIYHAKKASSSKDKVIKQKAQDILSSEESLKP